MVGVPPGQYRLSMNALPAASGWALRSAMLRGVDVFDVPFVVEPGRNIDDVVVSVIDQPTEISGTLQTPEGIPTADFFIIVFSTDKRYWNPGTRRSVMTRPTSAGTYSIRNLPPGEYGIAAVTDVEQGDWFDPEFLARLLAASPARITLGEGEKKTLNLQAAGR
jgi:hypothetical protein